MDRTDWGLWRNQCWCSSWKILGLVGNTNWYLLGDLLVCNRIAALITIVVLDDGRCFFPPPRERRRKKWWWLFFSSAFFPLSGWLDRSSLIGRKCAINSIHERRSWDISFTIITFRDLLMAEWSALQTRKRGDPSSIPVAPKTFYESFSWI